MKAKLIRGLSFQLTEDMHAQITTIATAHELSLGETIRQLITIGLNNLNKEETE